MDRSLCPQAPRTVPEILRIHPVHHSPARLKFWHPLPQQNGAYVDGHVGVCFSKRPDQTIEFTHGMHGTHDHDNRRPRFNSRNKCRMEKCPRAQVLRPPYHDIITVGQYRSHQRSRAHTFIFKHALSIPSKHGAQAYAPHQIFLSPGRTRFYRRMDAPSYIMTQNFIKTTRSSHKKKTKRTASEIKPASTEFKSLSFVSKIFFSTHKKKIKIVIDKNICDS